MSLNGFRLAADSIHLFALLFLFWKIVWTKSCSGISRKSQVLFCLVYTTRYMDLFSYFISYYNSAMKITFIVTVLTTLLLMYFKFKATYDKEYDIFRVEFILIPVVVLAFVVNHEFLPLEVLWTFSIYLESVAILPQMLMILKIGKASVTTSFYLFCLGIYKGFYILNWGYRYYYEGGYYDPIAITAGSVQTIIYCLFFIVYISKKPDAQKYFLQNLQDEYLYSSGVAHRDLKKNMLFPQKGNVKASDFGIFTVFSQSNKEKEALNNKCVTIPFFKPEIFSRDYNIPEDTVPLTADDSTFTLPCSDLEQKSAVSEESNDKLSLSMPSPLDNDAEKSCCVPENMKSSSVGISFSQSREPDRMVSSTQLTTTQTV